MSRSTAVRGAAHKTRETDAAGRRASTLPATDAVPPRPAASRWNTLLVALSGSLLWWLTLPPLNLWPLAWIAPVPWLWLARRETMSGRRPYRAIWVAAMLFWLATLQWVRYPHPATAIGWVALAAYLACYAPLLLWLIRVGVHRYGLPLVCVAPVVWTGLELLRGHMLGGFLLGSLAHTQIHWPAAIQIADLGGQYLVDFVMVLVAAAIAQALPCPGSRQRWWPLAPAAAALAAMLVYGHVQLGGARDAGGLRVALLQGTIIPEVKHNPDKQQLVFEEYLDLTMRALRAQPNLDLIVWPETMFREPLRTMDEDGQPPHDAEWTVDDWSARAQEGRELIRQVARTYDVPLLLGIDRHHLGANRVHQFNAALLVSREGEALASYEKKHLVMFGEYIPFAESIPALYQLTPLAGGASVGERDDAFQLEGTTLAANICYESILPHVIRGQVARLAAQDQTPDVLVNLTNDGWYRGSSELDMHLACGVLRAVENRRPFLIAANTGITAWIDAQGRVKGELPRLQSDVLVADVGIHKGRSVYTRWGDVPAGGCLVVCLLLAAGGLVRRPTRPTVASTVKATA